MKAVSAWQRGFSLIEIILVVVLIGGIVAFAATRILGGGDRARVRLAEAQVQTLAEKVHQFEMDTGSLPATLDQLVVQPGGAVGWLGPYAKESELRDPWNTAFEYRAPGDGCAAFGPERLYRVLEQVQDPVRRLVQHQGPRLGPQRVEEFQPRLGLLRRISLEHETVRGQACGG